MSVSILDYETSTASVLESNTVSLTKMQAHPLTEPYAASFEAFQGKIISVMTQEILLTVSVYKAAARVSVRDDVLDELLDFTSRALLNRTNGDRTAPLYMLYFGDERPSDIKKPILGAQLERMRGWVTLLAGSSDDALVALGAQIAAAVAEADLAQKAHSDAKLKLREFRRMGERKALIDEFNAMRKSTHGDISELPHKYPEKNLPGSFADRFFRHEASRKSDAAKEMTPSELAGAITDAEAKLAELRGRREEALAKEEKSSKAKAKAEAVKAALEDAKKAATEAKARVAALEAELETTT